jgi:hypothetical protein
MHLPALAITIAPGMRSSLLGNHMATAHSARLTLLAVAQQWGQTASTSSQRTGAGRATRATAHTGRCRCRCAQRPTARSCGHQRMATAWRLARHWALDGGAELLGRNTIAVVVAEVQIVHGLDCVMDLPEVVQDCCSLRLRCCWASRPCVASNCTPYIA